MIGRVVRVAVLVALVSSLVFALPVAASTGSYSAGTHSGAGSVAYVVSGVAVTAGTVQQISGSLTSVGPSSVDGVTFEYQGCPGGTQYFSGLTHVVGTFSVSMVAPSGCTSWYVQMSTYSGGGTISWNPGGFDSAYAGASPSPSPAPTASPVCLAGAACATAVPVGTNAPTAPPSGFVAGTYPVYVYAVGGASPGGHNTDHAVIYYPGPQPRIGVGDPATCGSAFIALNENVASYGLATVNESCRWYGAAFSGGGQIANTVGNMFDGDWRGLNAFQLQPGFGAEGTLAGAAGLAFVQAAPRALPVGSTSVMFIANIQYGRDTPSPDTTTGAAIVTLYDASGGVVRSVQSSFTLTQATAATVQVAAQLGVGEVAYRVGVQLDNGGGPYFNAAVGGYGTRVSALTMYFGTSSQFGAIGFPANCAAYDPTCQGLTLPPSGIVPPGGAPVCGPLSGDCSKPFMQLPVIATCVSPANGLDIAGWLAQIWCEIVNLPARIGAFVITAVNALIDLLVPGGGAFASVRGLQDDIASRTPFSYMVVAIAQVQGLLANPGGADPPFTVTFPQVRGVGGGTFTIPSFASAMPSGVRGAMGGLIYLATALSVIRVLMGLVGGRGPGGDEG